MSGNPQKVHIEKPIPHPRKPYLNAGDSAEAEYKVGYRRPPEHSRFKPGQSGNPTGRPTGRPNAKTMFERVIHKKVSVRQGESTREMPMLEAMVEAHAVKGIKGDVRSAGLVLNLLPKAGLLGDQQHEPDDLGDDPIANRPAKWQPSSELFENVELTLLSVDEKVELSRLAAIVDLGGGMTALTDSDFRRAREIVNRGRGKDITPSE